AERHAGEVSAAELRAGEVGAAERRAGEVGVAELRAGEVGAAEARTGEVSAAEPCVGQMEISQVDFLPLGAVRPVGQRGQGCLDIGRWYARELGWTQMAAAAPDEFKIGSAAADELGEYLDDVVVVGWRVAHDVVQG